MVKFNLEFYGSGDMDIDDEALNFLKEMIEEYGEDILIIATKLAKHAGRKTVEYDDVALALE